MTRREAFASWYQHYPRKVGKRAAWKSWERLDKAGELPDLGVMLAKLEQQRRTRQWLRDGGDFIPYPATYLNQGRWEDEVQIETRAPEQQNGASVWGTVEERRALALRIEDEERRARLERVTH